MEDKPKFDIAALQKEIGSPELEKKFKEALDKASDVMAQTYHEISSKIEKMVLKLEGKSVISSEELKHLKISAAPVVDGEICHYAFWKDTFIAVYTLPQFKTIDGKFGITYRFKGFE